MSGKTFLLVEDHEAVALSIKFALEKEGFTVKHAETAGRARQLAQVESFDLAILDVGLPDGNGFDLCREFRLAGMTLPILMLTGNDEVLDIVLGLELGADDYMTKPYEIRELIARVRALLRRASQAPATLESTRLQVGDLVIDLASQRVTRDDTVIHLTATEFKLLAFLAQHPDQPYSRQALLKEVWGYESFVGDARTVDVHMRNLRQKIEPDPSNPRLLVTVRRSGYKLVSGN